MERKKRENLSMIRKEVNYSVKRRMHFFRNEDLLKSNTRFEKGVFDSYAQDV